MEENNTQAALDAGQLIGSPKVLMSGRVLGVVVPAGTRLEQIDLEKFQPTPTRKHGTVTLATAASFIDWVNRNKTPEAVIYAKESDTSFLAIFNGHKANVQPTPGTGDTEGGGFTLGAPGWGDFTSRYGCPLSDEWRRWHGNSQHAAEQKRGMPHAEFIQFIEDNILDVTEPESGRLLAALARFEARRDVKIVSGKRLDNGDVAFAYSEDTVQVKEGQSDLTLPSKFTITIPVFKGGTPYIIDANLRFRASANTGLVLWYELIRPHKSLEVAFKGVADAIRDGTSLPMFNT